MNRMNRIHGIKRLCILFIWFIPFILVNVSVGASPPAPAPRDVLGFVPGEDRKLAEYASIVEYFRRLDASSDRVRIEEIGRTTLDRPMLLAVVSSSRNLARLGRIREVQCRLADPRGLSEAQTRALAAEGRAVMLVTFGIHSTEVGSTLASTLVAHHLATDTSPETREILDNCVVLIVPSLNPDGVDIVKRWYDASLGQPWEGTSPPELYHHYTGHDNNRDWYAFTQLETRHVVDRVHNVWKPHVVNDVHQQGAYGSRIFLPPYLDPIEPNVPSEIVAGANAIGTAAAWSLTSAGYPGVVTNAIYDAWTPARAYSHYHGGIRILSETASARIATPIEVKPEELRAGRGYDSRRASANFPAPWRGGAWRLANIVDYMTASTHAVLLASARNRARLLEGFARIGRDAVTHAPGEPFAFVIPPEPEYLTGGPIRPLAGRLLFDTLARGGVEVRIARAPFRAGGRELPAGSAVVAYDQPYGAFAKALLERQQYPDLRATPNGPPVTPYDVTAHTLSLLMGFEAVRVEERFDLPPGDPHPAPPADAKPAAAAVRTLKVGLYGGAVAPMDEGWTRWYFDQLGVAYERLDEREIKKGRLTQRVDVIVLPDMPARSLASGRAAGTVPPDVAGGLGETGRRALELFVEEGGTLVALNAASGYAIDALGLPVRDGLSGVARTEFYGPGSILGLDVDAAHPLAAGIAPRTIAWFENGPALEVREGTEDVRVVARFAPEDRLLQSGWLLGGSRIAGRPAIVEVGRGKGRVVLFAFRPQYRGQSWATLPFLLNALRVPDPIATAIGSDDRRHQSRSR
jgi:hypothetical protein